MRIANRYRPFSHQPGTATLIPGSSAVVTAYPTRLTLELDRATRCTLKWHLKGLIEEFTVMQDLEQHAVRISGRSQEGFFCYALSICDKHVALKLERGPTQGMQATFATQDQESVITLHVKSKIMLGQIRFSALPSQCLERISFGVAKKQDWDLLRRRKEPLEYFPLWFLLGQTLSFSHQEKTLSECAPSTLVVEQACQDLKQGAKEKFLTKLHQVFQSSFHSLMVPSAFDCYHHGLNLPSKAFEADHVNIDLLYQGYKAIRAMLITQEDGVIQLLQHLPAAFHAGRACNLTLTGSLVDFEWSKKFLKKVTLTVFEAQTFLFSFQKDLKTFRLAANQENNKMQCQCNEPLTLSPGIYVLDQFKK